MAFLILFPAAARARIVAADLVAFDHLLLRGSTVAADQLQLGQFFVLVALHLARYVLYGSLGRAALLLDLRGVAVFFFLAVLLLREWHHRGGPPETIAAARIFAPHLQVEEVTQGLVFDPVHHVLEEDVGFLLVLHQRVLLAITA
jgi:hypothetical protein